MPPLQGLKVVAFEQAIAVPFASYILGEMGADVVKIERPGRGDVVRAWDSAVKGMSSGFVAWNGGKRDLAVDASSPRGREIVQRLSKAADVFLENFAPGVVERLGIGPETLMKANDRLIYASLSGYGGDGPFRDRKAYDLLIQGESGLLLGNGYPDAPAKVGIPVTDQIGGSHLLFAVLGALYERERTGKGTRIDVSLLDCSVFWQGYFPHYHFHGLPDPPRSGMRHQFICPYGPFRALDGIYVNLAVASDEHWQVFCREVLQAPELAVDPELASSASRRAKRERVDSLVEEAISAEESGVWFDRLRSAGLPHGHVRSVGEAVEHPQIRAHGLVVRADSEVGEIPLLRLPGPETKRDRRVPAAGWHTQQILEELGYEPAELESLRAAGVIQ